LPDFNSRIPELQNLALNQPWPTRGPSTDSEKRYFGAKSTRISEKVQILALKMAIFQKCGPRADLGWPWLA
jgi:hypothetical protein